MGRRCRRFGLRVAAVGVALVSGWASYHRWQLRRSAVTSLSAGATMKRPPSHAVKLGLLADSTKEKPFDVLVVGGGAIGLYTAVDAAQRGLRVALVNADDFGSSLTGTSPPLIAGAFPYVQRALRQRDFLWLRRGVEAWRALTVWSNVAPGLLQSGVSTLIPSSHFLELTELVVAAVIATLLSPFLGAWKPFRFVRGSALRTEGHGAETEMQGGVLLTDSLLDGNAASVALARTAEALGAVVLNYASVTSIADVEAASAVHGRANFAVVVNDVSAPKGAEAPVPRGVTVYTRSIVNCAGSWVDEVKQLMPNNAADAVPTAVARHQVRSYFVLPRSAVRPVITNGRLSCLGSDALLLSPTSYSFASMMLLPWFDDCVLIGPSLSSLSRLPSKSYAVAPTTVLALVDTANNRGYDAQGVYKSQRRHLCRALQLSGVNIDEDRVLSCLSSIVPVIAPPSRVPWAEEVFMEGCHVIAGGQQPNVVHVYGGTVGFARDIAEKAVDRLLHDSGAFTTTEATQLRPCQTRRLALVGAQSGDAGGGDVSPVTRLQKIVREEYAVRVLDVVARRRHTAYSSPAEALAALPAIAEVMRRELGWTAERTQAELDSARAFIRSISVA
ncbi:putative glycerol-3-phosphate dehydrogenase (FAD-dependent) [Trypanosoma conorhini]|uniref:Putative glycerol-3-phosphate dehydrogenase (FAD-dependent) n=1 Tax=Trypanosoma conorhini TaxID=83891 RepID=A0A422PZI5_9TRYP|nr:putative glycerol-3-phosphate dehydrogenase (FAD-dependent) [Trypanosoma conorhini]RNF23175.1 putative glycerol-3-phosphate dehydrogenase (FAD-dependent) [Trypanosoma conorhini]